MQFFIIYYSHTDRVHIATNRTKDYARESCINNIRVQIAIMCIVIYFINLDKNNKVNTMKRKK